VGGRPQLVLGARPPLAAVERDQGTHVDSLRTRSPQNSSIPAPNSRFWTALPRGRHPRLAVVVVSPGGQREINKNCRIICGDCEKVICWFPNEVIDLVVTSPPYNVGLGENKYNKRGYDLYNDKKGFKDYIEWLKSVFSLLKPKMRKGGRICINVGDGKNGKVPTHVFISSFMMSIGYLPISIIVWDKKETSNRASWGSWLSPSCPSFPRPFEYILIFANETRKLCVNGETDLIKEEFIKYSYGLWEFSGEKKGRVGHPAPFPEELPYRLIKMLSWKRSVVFDPFCGSGTTCVVANKLGRKTVGIDISEEYCKIARDRIEQSEKEK